MAMLDSLASAGMAPAPGSMVKTSKPLKAARDAVDGHRIWDLDPSDIIDSRPEDRLEMELEDLIRSIETSGQSVPILVRRHPDQDDKYLLVYGARRLAAIMESRKVDKVRAMIATLDDTAAIQAQISENAARHDLTFMEKALFAHELVDSGFGKAGHVADVLGISKSAISMMLRIVDMVTPQAARQIGAAYGVGRPKWEAVANAVADNVISPDKLIQIAQEVQRDVDVAAHSGTPLLTTENVPILKFKAVEVAIAKATAPTIPQPKPATRSVGLGDAGTVKVARTKSGLRLDVGTGAFADWLDHSAEEILTDLHMRWLRQIET